MTYQPADPPTPDVRTHEDVADGDHTAGTAAHNQRADAPHPSGGDRLAIYVVSRKGASGRDIRDLARSRKRPNVERILRGDAHGEIRRRIAETSLSGLGCCLEALHGEGEFEHGRVGVFDRESRVWLISPWAGTSPWIPTGDD